MCRSPQRFSPRSAQKQSENMRFPQTFKKGGADPRKQTLSGWVGKQKTHTQSIKITSVRFSFRAKI